MLQMLATGFTLTNMYSVNVCMNDVDCASSNKAMEFMQMALVCIRHYIDKLWGMYNQSFDLIIIPMQCFAEGI